MCKFTKVSSMLEKEGFTTYKEGSQFEATNNNIYVYIAKENNNFNVVIRDKGVIIFKLTVKNQGTICDVLSSYMCLIEQPTQEEEQQDEVVSCETIETVDIETYHDITTNGIYALNPYNDNDDDKIKVYTIQGDTLTYSHTISLYHMESFFEYVDTFKINVDDIYIIETQATSCDNGEYSMEMWAEKDTTKDEMFSLIDDETGKIIAQTTKEEYKKRLSFLERWDKNNYLYDYSGYCDGIKKEYEQLKNMSYLMFESDLSVLPNTYDEKIGYFNRAIKVCNDNITRLIINCKNLHDIIDDYMENIYYKKACQNIIDDIDGLKHTYNMH